MEFHGQRCHRAELVGHAFEPGEHLVGFLRIFGQHQVEDRLAAPPCGRTRRPHRDDRGEHPGLHAVTLASGMPRSRSRASTISTSSAGISERSVVASVNMVSSGSAASCGHHRRLVDDIASIRSPPVSAASNPAARPRAESTTRASVTCIVPNRKEGFPPATRAFDAPEQVSRHFRSPPPPPRSRHEARGRCSRSSATMSVPVQVGDWALASPAKARIAKQKGRHEQPVKEAGGPEGEAGLAGLAGSDVELHGHGGQNGRRKRAKRLSRKREFFTPADALPHRPSSSRAVFDAGIDLPSSTGWHGQADPGLCGRSPPRPKRMRGEGMAQRMRRGGVGQPSPERIFFISRWMMAGDNGPPLAPRKERLAARQMVGGKACGKPRPRPRRPGSPARDASLPPFAGDAQRTLRAPRETPAIEAQRLRYAQPAAIKQRQHGGVARRDPGLFVQLALGRDDFFVHPPRKAALAGIWAVLAPAAPWRRLCSPGRAVRESAGRSGWRPAPAPRCAAPAPPCALRQEGAQIGGSQIGYVGNRRRAAEMPGEEGEELARVALIGLQRERGQPALVAQHGEPVRSSGDQVGTRIDEEFFHGPKL